MPPTSISHAMGDPSAPAVVVMAKPAVPGAVKSRLIGPLSAEQAAEVHAAMLSCVLERAGAHLPGEHYLALAQPAADASPLTDAAAEARGLGWQVIDQGTGDLGQRLDHVWRRIGRGAVVFLGIDSPDVPAASLEQIAPALTAAEAAFGPVPDGGYWTLAARAYHPELLQGIDWGTERVQAQTRTAAAQSGLTLTPLPEWYDVDDARGLRALIDRLATTSEPALTRLSRRLETLRGALR